jgi:Flp pilus assembly pilin Flp
LEGHVRELQASASEDGQALVEYTLILLLVALVAVPMLSALGVSVGGPLTAVTGAL